MSQRSRQKQIKRMPKEFHYKKTKLSLVRRKNNVALYKLEGMHNGWVVCDIAKNKSKDMEFIGDALPECKTLWSIGKEFSDLKSAKKEFNKRIK